MRTLILSIGLLATLSGSPGWAANTKKPISNTAGVDKPLAGSSVLTIVYLSSGPLTADTRPFFDPTPKNLGVEGSELGVDDNNTTGRFTGQRFQLKKLTFEDAEKRRDQFKALIASGQTVFVIDLPPEELLTLARLPESSEALLLDIANSDDRLRGKECLPNTFFVMPSDAMRTDALAQYFGKKRWSKWFLVRGSSESDLRFAEATRHSAKKFGSKIVKDAVWSYSFDDRRTPESEIPVFTQEEDSDVIWVADSENQFGEFFPYRTWHPRLTAGSAGLRPTAWHKAHEMWGGLQLQNRFRDKFLRPMEEKDYIAWLAIRSIGEAATRSHSTKTPELRQMLLDPSFSLAGFKGVPLSFRKWDHQMRQPILLGTDRSVVGFAPIEGYLHPTNTLDTLGYDEPESSCKQ
jgi:ABC transporter substrate binding protein (PQQ-dependent alcohol dehydrogenase system)